MRFTNVILCAVLCLASVATWASSNEEASTEAIEAAAQQLITEGEQSEETPTVEPVAAAEKAPVKESEIPVVLTSQKESKSETSFGWRILASFAILAVVAGSMIYASKRWAKRGNVGGQKARIEIMHQLHLGPRKSLALIRVSGEAVLIGMTDQNISMLKTVTLIDDELESVLGKDFNNFLEDEFSIEDVRNAIAPRA